MDSRLSKTGQYKNEMSSLLEDIGKVFVDFATNADKSGLELNDFDAAIMLLWRIIGYALFEFISDFQDKKKFYSVAGSVRLLLECVADAHHLSNHLSQARKYWQNQKKIKVVLEENEGNEWPLFTNGTLNKYGSLGPTMARIEASLGQDAVGAYNFLCFFTHPNIASVFWLDGDTTGAHLFYLMDIVERLVAIFIHLTATKTSVPIEQEAYLKRLDEINKVFK